MTWERAPSGSNIMQKDSKRLAIIVPAATDLNRGDQALVWEAAALAIDSGLFDELAMIDAGQASEESQSQTQQTQALGNRVLSSLMRDPRRGRNKANDKIREGFATFSLLAIYSFWDFVQSLFVLTFAPWPGIAKVFLDARQKETFDAIRKSSALFVKGGGFLHAHGGVRAPYYIWYQLFYLRLAHRLGKPVYILPNSFGPFRGLTVATQIRRVLSKCRFIAARETVSRKALEEVLHKTVPVYPDMGYFLDAAPDAVGETACLEAGVPLGTKPCVGFTVRPWRFPGLSNPEARFNAYLDSIAELVRHTALRGFHPVLITHVLGPSAHENDNLAIDELLPRLQGVSFSRIDHPGDCSDLKSIYGRMRFVVGTRFHSVIFAQGAGTPAIAVAYGGNKGTGIMRDMGLGDFVIPIEDVTAASLCKSFDALTQREDEVKRAIQVWMEKARAARQEMLDFIRHDFGSPTVDARQQEKMDESRCAV